MPRGVCECGTTNQWGNVWRVCDYHTQSFVLPPDLLADLPRPPDPPPRGLRADVWDQRVRAHRMAVIEYLREHMGKKK